MIKGFCSKDADPIKLLEEREAILTLLPQTAPRLLKKNYEQYTINPKTRYLSLHGITPRTDVRQYFDTDAVPFKEELVSDSPPVIGTCHRHVKLYITLIYLYISLPCSLSFYSSLVEIERERAFTFPLLISSTF